MRYVFFFGVAIFSQMEIIKSFTSSIDFNFVIKKLLKKLGSILNFDERCSVLDTHTHAITFDKFSF